MRLIKLKKRWVKMISGWLVCMAVLVLGYIMFVIPGSVKASRQRQIISDKAKEIEKLTAYVSEKNMQDLRKHTEMLMDRLSMFTTEIETAGECTFAISNIAQRLGTRDFSTKQDGHKAFSKVDNSELLLAAKIDISCRGSSDQFLRLVNEYERYRPIVLIEKFSISVSDDGLNEIKMSLTILIDNRPEKVTSKKDIPETDHIWRGV